MGVERKLCLNLALRTRTVQGLHMVAAVLVLVLTWIHASLTDLSPGCNVDSLADKLHR
jgi:hypothetical protein